MTTNDSGISQILFAIGMPFLVIFLGSFVVSFAFFTLKSILEFVFGCCKRDNNNSEREKQKQREIEKQKEIEKQRHQEQYELAALILAHRHMQELHEKEELRKRALRSILAPIRVQRIFLI